MVTTVCFEEHTPAILTSQLSHALRFVPWHIPRCIVGARVARQSHSRAVIARDYRRLFKESIPLVAKVLSGSDFIAPKSLGDAADVAADDCHNKRNLPEGGCRQTSAQGGLCSLWERLKGCGREENTAQSFEKTIPGRPPAFMATSGISTAKFSPSN